MHRLSVVISAYDQHETTLLHVEECMKSTLVPYEIVVINDGGSDSLRGMLKGIENKTCPIIYSRVKEDIRWNYTGARNLGIFLASSDLIAIEDNDHIPDRKFYEEALNLIAKGNDLVFPKSRWFVLKKDIAGKPPEDWKPIKSTGPHCTVSVMRRSFLALMKGFDENFAGHYGWNGTDVVKKIKRLAPKIASVGKYFMFYDSFSKTDDRPKTPGGKYRSESHNHRYLQKNLKSPEIQSDKGIINFHYDYEVIR